MTTSIIRRLILIIAMIAQATIMVACPVCQKQQPKVFKGITHGAGPKSDWDMVVVWTVVGIILLTAFYAVKWLAKPGEGASSHIKHFILNNSEHEGAN